MLKWLAIILLTAGTLAGCQQESPSSQQLHAFYYPWYGTPEHDGQYVHWRHDVLAPGVDKTFPGGDDIGADYYPAGGCYSSGDPEVLSRQMKQLQQADIGVICVSWLGAGSFEAKVLTPIMNAAAEHGIKVNFHLEPKVQKSMHTVREAIVTLIDLYGDHPAFYRSPDRNGRGMFYVYDSYQTPMAQWKRLLTSDGDLSIRGTEHDAIIIGLILNESDTTFIEDAGMDGGYSYFIVDGFSYASTTANWPKLVAWAREKDLLFIPSVGPGYSDLRIRPWNNINQRERNEGQYFDCMFAKAVEANPAIIAITSFNEWHEGTQIEPAMPFAARQFTYLDYQPLASDEYLNLTASWRSQWIGSQAGESLVNSGANAPCGDRLSRGVVTHLAVGKELTSTTEFSEKYAAGGRAALLDGITGTSSYRDGCWQGYEGVDLQVEIDLGQEQLVGALKIGFLSDPGVWVFLPKEVIVEGSDDGIKYYLLGNSQPEISIDSNDAFRLELQTVFEKQKIRYVRVTVKSEKLCPPAHPGEGQAAWLFVDEIMVLNGDPDPANH